MDHSPVDFPPRTWAGSFGHRKGFSRYANSVEVANRKSQKDMLRVVQGRYCAGARFILLSVDMALLGTGRLRRK